MYRGKNAIDDELHKRQGWFIKCFTKSDHTVKIFTTEFSAFFLTIIILFSLLIQLTV